MEGQSQSTITFTLASRYFCSKQNEEEAPKIVTEEPAPVLDEKKGGKDGGAKTQPGTQKKLGK